MLNPAENSRKNPRRGGRILQGAIPEKRQRKCPTCGVEPGMFCRSVRPSKVGIPVRVKEHRER